MRRRPGSAVLWRRGKRGRARPLDGGIVASLLAAGLLHLLVASTPRPRAFFGWIVGLLTVVAALLPLTWTSDLTSALSTGAVNLLVGIAIWSLLTGVLGWTMHRTPATA